MADQPSHSNIPLPDPTTLTTDQSNRLREEMQREIAHVKEFFEARLTSIERSIVDAEARATKKLDQVSPDLLALTDEKFASIAKQFAERDVRTEQAASATKIAVDAALLAQKELVNAQNVSNAAALAKSEAGFVKEIDSLKALLAASAASLGDRVQALSSRLDRGEGISSGAQATSVERRSGADSLISIVAVVIAVAAVAVQVFRH